MKDSNSIERTNGVMVKGEGASECDDAEERHHRRDEERATLHFI